MFLLFANVVWPALYLVERLNAVAPVVAGLIVECAFLRYYAGLHGLRALGAGVSMNFASALLGMLLIPLTGLGWEFVATFTVQPLLDVGTFNPATWMATALLAALTNAVVEAQVLKRCWGVSLSRQFFCLLALANLATVGLACLSLHLHPPKF